MKKELVVFLLITVIFVSGCTTSFSELHAILPNLAGKQNGVYRGEYSVSSTPVKVTLEVTVENEKLSNIKIINHICSPIGKKAEKIIDSVISRQSLDIDAISGATASSKGILKAVENALR